MTEQSLIYGVDVHSRSIASFPAEENRSIFIVASYSLKENQIFLLEADDRWSRINGKKFSHDKGEVLHLSTNPITESLIFSKCSFTPSNDKTISSQVSICELNEAYLNVKTHSIFSCPKESHRCLKTEFNSDGSKLGILTDNSIFICDVESAANGNTMKESFSEKFNGKTSSFVWDKHSKGKIVYVSYEKDLAFVDIRSDKPETLLSNRLSRITAIDCNPLSPNQISCGSEDGKLTIWDIRNTDKPVLITHEHQHMIWDIKYNHTYPQLLLSCGSDGRVFLYNCNEKENRIESDLIVDNDDSIYSCCWTGNDAFTFASIAYDGKMTASKVRKTLKYKLLSGS
uniref:EIPR1-like beta-propeller domain-containing protein n=1 Tax=Panagrolaimus superbus TaxID=310955 RepID=A0A914YYP6_9BILA